MDSRDKEFFQKMRVAAFANPFGQERASVDLELTGLGERSQNEQVIFSLIDKVKKRIAPYKGKLNSLSASDRGMVRYAILFYFFHIYCDAYDKLIVRQIKSGGESLRVSFYKEVVQQLYEYGLSSSEARRFFAFFFQLRRGFYFISAIIGKSDSVSRLRQALWNNIFTYDTHLYENHLWNRMEDFSTIILGETGTGKGMAAASIGRSAFIPFDEKKNCFKDSFAKTFIAVNLSQFSEDLIESELFGHAKGAFTGAIDNHKGVFSRCSSHGAIFLDEIGDVSIPLQIKLLQVLQERVFSPVGSHVEQRFQGRVIAATNQPLTDLRKQQKFRDDFYYRLCSDTIEVPSLRKRLDEYPGELQLILRITLKRILGHEAKGLARDIGKSIQQTIPDNYSWPGNIRELEQCVRQMLLNRSYNWSGNPETKESLEDFQKNFLEGNFSASKLLASYCQHLYAIHGTYEEVAKRTQLDRRTVKRYIELYD